MLEAAKKIKLPPFQSPASVYQNQIAQSSGIPASTRNMILGAAAILLVGGVVFYLLQRKGK